ncbi:proline-rich receptor-like protein kinase PERK2 [Zingiber officinale]|uniref:Uncharacterized protein n=1 Tax=Zingiber officinale TaxID=94328 RepID=A0A8J5FJG6_ZINOF|nr:proline-rich receptor-like protein kinase PERK2 [Zingiber officinale]KAG6487043.1 hypothetical protein ZIOFF_055625 [Zingiber officinale]
MCYVGKATKIFFFLTGFLLLLGLVVGFGLSRHGWAHKAASAAKPCQYSAAGGGSCSSIFPDPIPADAAAAAPPIPADTFAAPPPPSAAEMPQPESALTPPSPPSVLPSPPATLPPPAPAELPPPPTTTDPSSTTAAPPLASPGLPSPVWGATGPAHS